MSSDLTYLKTYSNLYGSLLVTLYSICEFLFFLEKLRKYPRIVEHIILHALGDLWHAEQRRLTVSRIFRPTSRKS